MVDGFLVLLLWFGFHANLPTANSTRPGPVGENYSNSPAGSGRSPFQDNARHHLHNRQYRSHAFIRAVTHQSLGGLAEPGCKRDCNGTNLPAPALVEFQAGITAPTGWLVLLSASKGAKGLESWE